MRLYELYPLVRNFDNFRRFFLTLGSLDDDLVADKANDCQLIVNAVEKYVIESLELRQQRNTAHRSIPPIMIKEQPAGADSNPECKSHSSYTFFNTPSAFSFFFLCWLTKHSFYKLDWSTTKQKMPRQTD